jgi:hypothetical protein
MQQHIHNKMTSLKANFLLFCTMVALTAPLEAEGARVLAFFLFSSKSHNNFYTPLLTELASRGHDVTVVTAYPLNNPQKNNYRQIDASVMLGISLTL